MEALSKHRMSWKIVSFCLIILFIPTIVKTQDSDVEKALYQPIDVPSPSPINVNTAKVKHIKTKNPLQLYQGLTEIINVTNTGNIVEAYLMPDDHSYITGGILGNKKYKLHKLRFYSTQNPIGRSGSTVDGLGGPLEPTIIYRNVKYETFDEALKHPDGVVQLSYCVVAVPFAYKLKFVPFEKTLSHIKEPSSSFRLLGAFTYLWYDHILQFKEYFAYRGSYLDIDSRKQYYGITQLIASPQVIGLSFEQFKAFQNLKGSDGKPLEAVAPIYEQGDRKIFHVIGVRQILHLI